MSIDNVIDNINRLSGNKFADEELKNKIRDAWVNPLDYIQDPDIDEFEAWVKVFLWEIFEEIQVSLGVSWKDVKGAIDSLHRYDIIESLIINDTTTREIDELLYGVLVEGGVGQVKELIGDDVIGSSKVIRSS